MTSVVYPPATREIGERRRGLAPGIHQAFDAFSRQVFADGALPGKTKQLIALAVAHVTQCPYCIKGHTKLAHRAGACDEEIMEAIWASQPACRLPPQARIRGDAGTTGVWKLTCSPAGLTGLAAPSSRRTCAAPGPGPQVQRRWLRTAGRAVAERAVR